MDDRQTLTPPVLPEAPDNEVSAQDLVNEDIDEQIEELPIDEARELYHIKFYIAEAYPGAPPLKDKDGIAVYFDTHDEANKALAGLQDKQKYTVVETRSLKEPEPTISFNGVSQ